MAARACPGEGGGVAGARAARRRARTGRGRPLLVAATLLAVALALVAPALGRAGPDGPRALEPSGLSAASPVPGADRREVEALAALRAWDGDRSEAWATGDVEALSRLYAPRTPAGAADVSALQAYTARGLVVVDLRSQVLAVDVVTGSPRSWRLRVTDRLVSGRAVPVADPAADGVALPQDTPTTREVLLLRSGGSWVLQEVRRVP